MVQVVVPPSKATDDEMIELLMPWRQWHMKVENNNHDMEVAMDVDRARSFIERYVVARASTFRTGEHEIEDMHACALMAKSAYRHIANVARDAEPPNFDMGQAGQAVQAGQPYHSVSPIYPGDAAWSKHNKGGQK